jgi:WD40 repeat protein
LEKKFIFSSQYFGHSLSKFFLRLSFAFNDNFIVSGKKKKKFISKKVSILILKKKGSEDCKIYIWDINESKHILTLNSHTGCTNCVSWNNNLNILASGSDDFSIKLWK